ncbi:hypothetical protein A3C28_02130 [Candidatus Roizmanbacteria bacterium RIFCSPHIGHO2_02_FULL_39_9]|uniref:DUF3105 domain-containing protein n=2 Tax=Candidatus Roizmaniibacteriota TaxID=1752723 RepID=A0A1F7HUH9_9BACT|nr:MAG: hypothetical protein A3C28_02130 [Candidatus Roizmanbacteria bacterium RIFCSPHIGHO2_02_FULL_39_9]OGK34817.1 MAG: hypothetical protein A3F60_03845 [Candidatus Roizmanbacteria bacterium RIFCSPHIGHO2_12_FULL_39_8]
MEKSNIEAEIEKLKQKPQLNRRERRYLAKLEKKRTPQTSGQTIDWKAITTRSLIVFGVLITLGGIIWYIRMQPNLPPIDMSGHIEQNPKSHVLNEAMPDPIQKHMLEHADGEGEPGVIIQYNCTKPYICESGLVDKLKVVVKKYPENVYLAPNTYDGVIILTKLNKREILDKFDEKKIKDFITF